jgi:hypothetical protein
MADPINKRLLLVTVELIRRAEMTLDYSSPFRRAIAEAQAVCAEAALKHHEQAATRAADAATAVIAKAMGVHS